MGARFRAPTPEEVGEYVREQGLRLDPVAFVDFYASKGWRVGSSPMRDWRAAARNWARRDRDRSGCGGSDFSAVPVTDWVPLEAEVVADAPAR